ncbi:MAG: hypothetical protein LBQ00_04430 [Syntrophobacterales bacterium]|jgi:hypothetical protein|nr:hypothetical protein [Syntrophobacterales bacterium]
MSSCILRNTLLAEQSIDTILSLPVNEDIYASLLGLLTKFQDIKKFASEIHTEIHLVKPILKNLGHVCESKPKFFEERIKEPDVALFVSEDERMKTSKLWGTREYYDKTIGIVMLKRYGRNLHEGVGGFYLEFENKMPVYQMIYLLKKSKTPWGILTNGKHWMLIRRPMQFEKRAIEIDLERAVFEEDMDTVRLFCQAFSCAGLKSTLPDILEEERQALIQVLSEKRLSLQPAMAIQRKKVDFYPDVVDIYRQFFSDWKLPSTELYLEEKNVPIADRISEKTRIINRYDHTDILSYLFTKKERQININLKEIIVGGNGAKFTKEDLFSLKILDITPGFGSFSTQLIDGLAYLSFILPYREKNTFRAEWEEESSLKRFIVNNLLHGIERSHISFDVLQNTIRSRFDIHAKNYRLGNPLIGMPLKAIASTIDSGNSQMSLFGEPPKAVIKEFKQMYALLFSLSERIKEDVKIRNATEAKLKIYTDRIRDLMDVITATYFTNTAGSSRIQDMLFNLDGSNEAWTAITNQDWFAESKDIAKRNGFFHFEIEFPFLLTNSFDLIFVQPALNYAWEEEPPIAEATKAFIKRSFMYLKQKGKLVIVSDSAIDQLIPELRESRRYELESGKELLILKRKI